MPNVRKGPTMSTTVDRKGEPVGRIRRAIRYVAGVAVEWHAANARKWSDRYESEVLADDRVDARRWAVESAVVQSALVFALLMAVKTPLANLEERYLAWDAVLPQVTEWALATGRYGWCLLPLVCLEAYLLFRFRTAGGVKAWYAEVAASLMLVFWVWFACVVCFAALIPFVPM
jgi:hypothetical protein